MNQLGHFIVGRATGQVSEKPTAKKNAKARTAGKKGGLKGGAVRAGKLSAEERSAIAKKAAKKRWEE